jgi:glycosyltransferase 2 family protein
MPAPLQRDPADLARVAAAAGILGGTSWLARRGVDPMEEDLFGVLNRLPGGLERVLWVPMQFGSLWGPFAAGGLVWRRQGNWRPAIGAVVAGVVSWQLAKAVKEVVERGRPLDEVAGVVRRTGTPTDGLGFVSGHTAVAVSVTRVLTPYLGLGGRVALRVLALVVGLSRIHVAAHLPLDVAGGGALGAMVGTVWNLTVGIPAAPVARAAGRAEEDGAA